MEQAIQHLSEQLNNQAQVITQLQGELQSRTAIDVQLQRIADDQSASLSRGQGADTKLLGRPDVFIKEEQWQDWATVFRVYATLLSPVMEQAMEQAEINAPVDNATLPQQEVQGASHQLHYTLTVLCRGEALASIQNSGGGEGFVAWQRLCSRYESSKRTPMYSA